MRLFPIAVVLIFLLAIPVITSAAVTNTSFPKAYYPFNLSLTADSSLNGFTLTNSAAALSSSTYVFGGNSSYFNGNARVYGTVNTINVTQPWSVAGWFNISTLTTSQSIFNYCAGGNAGISMLVNSGSGDHLLVNNGVAGGTGPTSSTSIVTGKWFYYVVAYNGSYTNLYINGTLVGSYSGNTAAGYSPTTISIGESCDSTAVKSTGFQDDFVMYNTAIDGTVLPNREFISNPTAINSANVTSGQSPLTVQFTDSSVGTGTLNYNWSATNSSSLAGGNGTPIYFSTLASPSVTLGVGNWSVNETVSNTFGASLKLTWVNVSIPKTNYASFITNETNPNLINGTLPIQFTDKSSNSPTLWNWTFGDGAYSSLQNPVHTYTSPGVYNVTLMATQGITWTSNYTLAVPVYIGVPYPLFTASPLTGSSGLLVAFTDLSYQGNQTNLVYNWSFGDTAGTNPYGNTIGNTSHVYQYNGLFTPNLTISNANGTSYYNGVTIVISSSQTQTYYTPQQVQLKFYDYNGYPLQNVYVTAAPINFTAPINWISTLLGINSAINIQGTTVGWYTDAAGSVVFPMVQSIQYNLTVSGTSTAGDTVGITFTMYPQESVISYNLPTNTKPSVIPTTPAAGSSITYSLTNSTDPSTQWYNMSYYDPTSSTTYLNFYILNATGVNIQNATYTGMAANNQVFNQSEPNLVGGSYTYGFLAMNSLGNMTESAVASFPLAVNWFSMGWPT